MKIVTRLLEPEEYHRIDHYFDQEGVPRLDPEWSKVFVSIDEDLDKIAGVMCLQLVPHVEPIIIDPEYRGQGIWRDLAEMMDGYVGAVGLTGAYCQPVNPKSQAIASKMGYEECVFPLYRKLYDKSYEGLRLSDPMEVDNGDSTPSNRGDRSGSPRRDSRKRRGKAPGKDRA